MRDFLVRARDKTRLLIVEARSKMTTYVAMLVASAGELHGQWDTLTNALPHWKWLTFLEHRGFLALGILMVYARVRRALRGA